MPTKPQRPCRKSGCPLLSLDGYCEEHKTEKYSNDRFKFKINGKSPYDYDWEQVRKRALKRDTYLCQRCLERDRTTFAVEVHHLVKIRTNPALRLVMSNLVSCCTSCHKELELLAQ